EGMRLQVTQQLCRIRPMNAEEQEQMMAQMLAQQQAQAEAEAAENAPVTAAPPASLQANAGAAALPGFNESDPSTWGNPARNDPCPCGSGEKFKHCHGRLA